MIIIPGWLVALVTFPGVIVHEAAHMLFCKIRGLAVLDVCFYRVGNPAGYVIHEQSEDFTSIFLVAVGPFIVNSILCFLFCFPAFVPVKIFDQKDLISYFLIWLGMSIGMHAFPSTGDAQVLMEAAKKAVRRMNLLAIISYPIVGLIYVANLLRIVWFDYLYGFALGFLLPEFILKEAA